jgi:hypothetical protein
MSLFHLNVFSDFDAQDIEGIELANLEVAKQQAVAGFRDLVAHDIRDGKPIYRSHRIEITDEIGCLLDTVRFEDIIDLRP